MSGAPDFTRLVSPIQVDELLAPTVKNFTQAGTLVDVGRAPKQYQGLKVDCEISGLASFVDLAAFGTNATKGLNCWPQSFAMGSSSSGRTFQTLYLPLAADAGDDLQVTLMSLGAGDVIGLISVAVYGLGQIPANAPKLRPDGRLPAVGYHAAQWGTGLNGTIITTLTGRSVLLRRIMVPALAQNAGVQFGQLTGFVGGVGVGLVSYGWGTAPDTGGAVYDLGDGLILDDGTAMAWSNTASPFSGLSGAVFYDIVA